RRGGAGDRGPAADQSGRTRRPDARAAGGVGPGAGGSSARWGPVDRGEGGDLDRRAPGAPRQCGDGLALSAPARLAALSAAPPARQSRSCGSAGLQKKWLSEQVAAVQAAHPTAHVEVWASDEHRVGLKPLLRTVWARKGQRPIARVQHRFQWLYGLGFVPPASGRNAWQFSSRINTATRSVALEHFARAGGAGATKRLVLVLAQAGYHTSPELVVPEGLHLVFLPPSSPELQPAEHVWPFSDEPLV